MKKFFPQGLNPEKVERFVETLESYIEQEAYVDEYISHFRICQDEIELFITTGDISILLDKEKPCLNELLSIRNIVVTPDSDIKKLKILLMNERHRFTTLTNQLKHIKVIIRKRKLRHDEQELKNKPDERIIINVSTAVLDDKLKQLAEKKYIPLLTPAERDCHFKCTDSSEEYNKNLSRTHRIQWLRPDTTYVIFLKELAREGLINNNFKKMNYTPFEKHFVNRRSGKFINLSKKYYNVKKSNFHKELRVIIKEKGMPLRH